MFQLSDLRSNHYLRHPIHWLCSWFTKANSGHVRHTNKLASTVLLEDAKSTACLVKCSEFMFENVLSVRRGRADIAGTQSCWAVFFSSVSPPQPSDLKTSDRVTNWQLRPEQKSLSECLEAWKMLTNVVEMDDIWSATLKWCLDMQHDGESLHHPPL